MLRCVDWRPPVVYSNWMLRIFSVCRLFVTFCLNVVSRFGRVCARVYFYSVRYGTETAGIVHAASRKKNINNKLIYYKQQKSEWEWKKKERQKMACKMSWTEQLLRTAYKVNWTLYLRQSISARSHYLLHFLRVRIYSKIVGNKPALYSRSMRSIFFQYRVCCQNMQAATMKNSKQAQEANASASVCQSSSIISTSDFSMTRKLWLSAELWDFKRNERKTEEKLN